MGVFTGLLEDNHDMASEREPGEQGKHCQGFNITSLILNWYRGQSYSMKEGSTQKHGYQEEKIIGDHLKVCQPKLERAVLQLQEGKSTVAY